MVSHYLLFPMFFFSFKMFLYILFTWRRRKKKIKIGILLQHFFAATHFNLFGTYRSTEIEKRFSQKFMQMVGHWHHQFILSNLLRLTFDPVHTLEIFCLKKFNVYHTTLDHFYITCSRKNAFPVLIKIPTAAPTYGCQPGDGSCPQATTEVVLEQLDSIEDIKYRITGNGSTDVSSASKNAKEVAELFSLKTKICLAKLSSSQP